MKLLPSVLLSLLHTATAFTFYNSSYRYSTELYQSTLVASETKSKLQSSLVSIGNKLTLSPEIVVPEPSNPTVLLLQNDALNKLSENMRTKAKCNAMFISSPTSSTTPVSIMGAEQKKSLGQFPGPIPIVYCGDLKDGIVNELVDAAVCGVMVKSEDLGTEAVQDCVSKGLQIIPEVSVAENSMKSDEDMNELVSKLNNELGSECVAVVITVETEDTETDEDSAEQIIPNYPPVAKSLNKSTPILGSVKVLAGENRMGSAVAALKEAGYAGALLRADCVPGFRMNPDLEVVAGFWTTAIGEMKSNRSKTFNFRSKNQMDKSDVPTAWMNYQKNVMESGALGESQGPDPSIKSDNGDYMGF